MGENTLACLGKTGKPYNVHNEGHLKDGTKTVNFYPQIYNNRQHTANPSQKVKKNLTMQ